MSGKTLPLIVLGGSDRKPAKLPPTGHGKHPLSGCKGVDVRIAGRCLIELVVERLEASGLFHPLYVAGPAAAYRAVPGLAQRVTLIDTDSGFGRNIQVGVETALESHPESSLAMTTCDILPEVAELHHLLANYHDTAPSDLWFPLILAPQDPRELGPSAWKPQYFVRPEPGAPGVRVLPGHLAVFDPPALRLGFLYRLAALGYRTRNRPVLFRRTYMLQRVLLGLLSQDLRHVLSMRLPTLTWDVVVTGVAAARRIKEGTITRAGLERAVRRVFVKRRHRKRYPERSIQLPLLPGLSLARDIDTEEEAAAVGASTSPECG